MLSTINLISLSSIVSGQYSNCIARMLDSTSNSIVVLRWNFIGSANQTLHMRVCFDQTIQPFFDQLGILTVICRLMGSQAHPRKLNGYVDHAVNQTFNQFWRNIDSRIVLYIIRWV
jgi:hypothetical protein